MLEGVYNWKNAPLEKIREAGVQTPPRKNRGGKRRKYQNIICAFDIETTPVLDKYAVMYIWQFQVGLNYTVVGRSWKEFRCFCARLKEFIGDGIYLVTYIHNAAYEMAFLAGIYKFKTNEVFAIDRRKPVRFDMYDFLEFRCSYIHSNMKLKDFLAKMGVKDQKVSGFDYEVKRYPWTPLSDEELLYCVNDVRGLVEALYVEMAHDGDNLYTIPATSTGYVRRDCREVMDTYPYYFVHDMLPNAHVYDMLRRGFRGGNTHCNRFYAGQAIPGVNSMDRSSSYPDDQCNRPFPMSPFKAYHKQLATVDDLEDLMVRKKRACLFHAVFRGLRLKDELWGCPYIPYDKCEIDYSKEDKDFSVDNGRILHCNNPLMITLTDVDWRIIRDEYEWDSVNIIDLHFARYGNLPDRLRQLIIQYYKLKTELKGDKTRTVELEKVKAKINSIYGLFCYAPAKLAVCIKNGKWDDNRDEVERAIRDLRPNERKSDPVTSEDIIQYLLDRAYRNTFLPYQWGVWVSAWGRYELSLGIKLAAAGAHYPMDDPRFSDFIYCDTDSVKYIGNVDWSELNAYYQKRSEDSGAFADDANGKRHYMGVYEADEGYPCTFASRGAKKYVTMDEFGHIKATISGVRKKDDPENGLIGGGTELERNGGLECFLRKRFEFVEAGGTMLLYNDTKRFCTKIDGHRLMIRPCVTIKPDVYTLSDGKEYAELLSKIKKKDFSKFLLDIRGKI